MITLKRQRDRVLVLPDRSSELNPRYLKLLEELLTFTDENIPRIQRKLWGLKRRLENPSLLPAERQDLETQARKLAWVEKSDGKICFLRLNPVVGFRSFGLGFLDDVVEHLRKNAIEFKVEDEALPFTLPTDYLKYAEANGIEDREYQSEAVRKFLARRRGILQLPTGSGKTEVSRKIVSILLAVATHKKFQLKTLFITSEKSLTQQAKDYYQKILGVRIGLLMEGKAEDLDAPVVCATIQSILARLKNKETRASMEQFLRKDVQFYVVDECHYFATAKRIRILRMMRSSFYALFLSATPYSRFATIKNMHLKEFSGGVLYTLTEKELVKKKVLSEQKALFIENHCPDYMLERGDARNFVMLYTKLIVRSSGRNELLLKVYQAVSKFGLKTLFLVERTEHGKFLYDLFKDPRHVEYLSGEDLVGRRKKCIQLLQTDKLNALITTNIFKKGVDIPLLQVVVNAGALKSDTSVIQMKGRMTRRKGEKDRALYIDFVDFSRTKLQDHSYERLITLEKLGVPITVANKNTLEQEIWKYFNGGKL